MSTWQIFSDAGNSFRWKISDSQLHNQESIVDDDDALAQQCLLPPCLPSMADLLLQGCSKLMENGYGNGNEENTPMFRTGLGKAVAVKKSSISKALSILGTEDDQLLTAGRLGGVEGEFSFSNTILETRSAKTDNLNPMLQNGFGGADNMSNSMFQTGFGRADNTPNSMFQTGFGRAGNTPNSMFQTGFGRADNPPNSMFQTGSGKAVNFSAAGLVKAKILLGLDENDDKENFQGFEHIRKQSSIDHPTVWQSSYNICATKGMTGMRFDDAAEIPVSPFDVTHDSFGYDLKAIPDVVHSDSKPPPIKFQTAGGRSLSVSSDALQRARSLLGDSELVTFLNEEDEADPKKFYNNSSNIDHDSSTPFFYQKTANNRSSSKNFTSPLKSAIYQKQSSVRLENIGPGNNLIKRFNEEAGDISTRNLNDIPYHGKPINKSQAIKAGFTENGNCSRIRQESSLRRALVDITNSTDEGFIDNKQNFGEKRRMGGRRTISPFKRPRNSKFITPLNAGNSSVPSLSTLAPKEPCLKGRVSARYPFQILRPYLREYFGEPPSCQSKVENLPDEIRRISSDTAESYMLHDESGLKCVGSEAFYHMLSHSGASMHYVPKEWVVHHYKWIIWKLASYERCYAAKFSGKLLTVSNVLEELKYRYEREVNHGHRSAIKRILEGDALPSSRMVLCISSVWSGCDSKIESAPISDEVGNCATANIELTDGWYSVNAVLDVLLLRKLAAGKLFVGQKLQIWGAGLCGWVGPVSPLEASKTISLQLHINGTYRAHWADRLGFCKGGGLPLAFRSIKCAGGPIPCTLVGVSRVYPVLYRERLSSGGFAVRSEKMESKAAHSFNQRQSSVVEGIMSDFQKDIDNDQDSEEGAKILKILETAAEPELLMAEMTSDQLSSFASYREKLEARRHSDMQRSLEKALETAGLSGREVTPFMRVRVVGLTSRSYPQQSHQQEGLVTIWNPTEKQKSEPVEGQAYAVAGLVPVSSDSSTLYLQARGSTTKWLPLSRLSTEKFRSFFSPRKPISVSNLGGVPLSTEFDIAAFVVHVGEVHSASLQKKQWVFVTDGSISGLRSKEPLDSLLAIRFCLQCAESDSFPLVNYNLAGSTVGFCNLIKKEKDKTHNLWVAEATENSIYFLNYDRSQSSHLKNAAKTAQNWAKISRLTIEKLKGRVLSIIGNCEV